MPARRSHAKFLDVYRRLDDVLGELVAALPAGAPLFIVADHGHTLIHREYYPNAWLREQGLLRFTSTSRRASPTSTPRRRSFVLDPGPHLRAPRGALPARARSAPAEADELLGRRARGVARASRRQRRRAGGRASRSARLRARRAVPRAGVDGAPDVVLHFNDGYDPKGALARTEVFGRSALTGMHTYDDSLFFVNRPGVPTDELDIIDLAPTILPLLGVDAAERHGWSRAPLRLKRPQRASRV